MIDQAAFDELIADVARRRGIPGLSAAFVQNGTLIASAAGVLNIETGVAATTDSVFQIGSITKVFTGTLVMQLVDEGRVQLDAPVATYLPDLAVDGRPVDARVTVRSLLAHTSAIVGDLFDDTGRNDDAVALYVERCAGLPYLAEPGERFSYCNSGFVILGRLIEVVTGVSWRARLRSALLEPLGIRALDDAEDAALFRTAAGHVLDDDGRVRLTPTPYLSRGTEPAGSRLAMSPTALLAFAQLHLRDGVLPDGRALLRPETARSMRETVVSLPIAGAGANGYGLSWALYDTWHPKAVGHGGNTIGQSASLELVPARNAALAVLTNVSSGAPVEAFDEIARATFGRIGVEIPPRPAPTDGTVADAPLLAGTYETHMSRITVTADGDALRAVVTQRNNEAMGTLPDHHLTLTPLDGDRFVVRDEPYGATSVVGFVERDAQGRPRYLFSGYRLARRVAVEASGNGATAGEQPSGEPTGGV